jgi:diguanylate cyclase (GGDEF)-like protein
VDLDLKERKDGLLRGLSAREAPRVLILFSIIIVLFDVGFALFGFVSPLGYYVSDAIQGLWNIATAVLIMRGVVSAKWAPAAFALAICVDNAMLNYQYTVVGYSAVGVILLTMTVYGAVTLVWRPFLISAIWMGALTSYTIMVNDPEGGLGWALTAITALLVSGTVLYGRIQAVAPLALANRTIEDMATRDALTGVLNRHGLDQLVGPLASIAERSGETLFATFVDIAGLKATNDTYGHLVGDIVIKRTADALRAQCREGDILCRWGGDEFIILGLGPMPDPDDFDRRVVASIDAPELDGKWVPAVSVGVAQGVDGDVDALISRADSAMYDRRHGLGR